MTPFTVNASTFGSFTDPFCIACNNELLFHTPESLTRPLDPTSAYKHSYSGPDLNFTGQLMEKYYVKNQRTLQPSKLKMKMTCKKLDDSILYYR